MPHPKQTGPTPSKEMLSYYLELGQEYKEWYLQGFRAASFLREHSGTSVDVIDICDLMSLMSPRVVVFRSLKFVCYYLSDGKPHPKMLAPFKRSVAHWEETGEIRGPKTSQFALALKGNQLVVPVDTHMAQMFNFDPIDARLKSARKLITKHIGRVAFEYEVYPAEAQAMVWCGWFIHNNWNVPVITEDTMQSAWNERYSDWE